MEQQQLERGNEIKKQLNDLERFKKKMYDSCTVTDLVLDNNSAAVNVPEHISDIMKETQTYLLTKIDERIEDLNDEFENL